MRVRFEIRSLASLGEGAHRIPLNCWRVTMWLNGNTTAVVDGVPLAADMSNAVDLFMQPVTLGGVLIGPNGDIPVMLDQTLQVTVLPARTARGLLFLEYIDQ